LCDGDIVIAIFFRYVTLFSLMGRTTFKLSHILTDTLNDIF